MEYRDAMFILIIRLRSQHPERDTDATRIRELPPAPALVGRRACRSANARRIVATPHLPLTRPFSLQELRVQAPSYLGLLSPPLTRPGRRFLACHR